MLRRSLKKNNADYQRWVRDFAPGVLTMVFHQLDVFRQVGAARGAEA